MYVWWYSCVCRHYWLNRRSDWNQPRPDGAKEPGIDGQIFRFIFEINGFGYPGYWIWVSRMQEEHQTGVKRTNFQAVWAMESDLLIRYSPYLFVIMTHLLFYYTHATWSDEKKTESWWMAHLKHSRCCGGQVPPVGFSIHLNACQWIGIFFDEVMLTLLSHAKALSY